MSETLAAPPEAPVSVIRTDPGGMIVLRARLEAPGVAAAVRTATGIVPPVTRQIVLAGARGAAWMSPDELLLFVPPAEVAETLAALGAALAGTPHLVADVSDARARFRLEGAGAREVIAKGAPVDLSPAAFQPGEIRRTRLGQVACAFWQAGPETFELICFRSVGGFVGDWLAAAARRGPLPGVL